MLRLFNIKFLQGFTFTSLQNRADAQICGGKDDVVTKKLAKVA